MIRVKKHLIADKFIKNNMKNLFNFFTITFLAIHSFSQTADDAFFEKLSEEEKPQTNEVDAVKTIEETLFSDFEFGLSLKKFTYPSHESSYIFYFHNDGNVYPGKMMTIDFNTWNEVAAFFNNTKRVIEQKKRTTYTFSNKSHKIHWATENLGIIYSGEQYCFISKTHIAEIILNLK